MTAVQQPLGLAVTSMEPPSATVPTSSPAPLHPTFLTPELYKLVTTPTPSVTSLLALDTGVTIQSVAEKLYGTLGHVHHSYTKDEEKEGEKVSKIDKILDKLHLKSSSSVPASHDGEKGEDKGEKKYEGKDQWESMRPLTAVEIEEIKKCGQWGGAQPSDLFLNIYAQMLLTLEEKSLNGMVSPGLMGSSGVIPLTIISVIPDIIQHHANVIVRAEHEIFLATNYWEASGAAKTIVDSFKELSRRVVARNGPKVVIKLMYDRGNPHQILDPHQAVDVKTYTGDKVRLPHPDEIPGCDLQVQNYHQPPVGTFHSKYMVVDRKVAILNSNNIQDRVNVEMMTHIEGPIVQSLYDMALLSWYTTLTPPLPLLTTPPTYPSNLTKQDFSWGHSHPLIASPEEISQHADAARETLKAHHDIAIQPHVEGQEVKDVAKGTWDQSHDDEATRIDSGLTDEKSISQHLNTGSKIDGNDTTPPPNAGKFKPVILMEEHDPVPMAMANRCPRGRPGHEDTFVPQDQAWLAAFKFAKTKVFIQTPTFNAKPVVEAALDACRRGILVEIYADLGFNDEGELLPFQGGTNEMVASYMYKSLSGEARDKLKIYWYTGKDQKTPLNASHKSRNCHVKLMIVDEHIAVQGNGNQDSQSWYHSQEINLLLDSPTICREWREAIDSNQNTLYYGLVDPADGIWRDKEGKTLPDWKPPPKGPLKSLVGVKGAIQRVRGEGGF